MDASLQVPLAIFNQVLGIMESFGAVRLDKRVAETKTEKNFKK